MGDIVNLRMARKARTRAAADATAAANRAAYGQPKTERERTARDVARLERGLDGAKRETQAQD